MTELTREEVLTLLHLTQREWDRLQSTRKQIPFPRDQQWIERQQWIEGIQEKLRQRLRGRRTLA